jgi:hypothetical protein
VIEVIGEVPRRGAVERVYALASGPTTVLVGRMLDLLTEG